MLKTIILGILQGIGEFLPISSSAHLILIPFLFNWESSNFSFDIALHFGTMLAVLIMFFSEWYNLFKGATRRVINGIDSFENKMFWYLVAATIPGAVIGLLLDNIVENWFRQNIFLISICLALMGIFIYLGDTWADKHYKTQVNYEDISLKQALIIGLSQSLAIIPGFSRSGTTILSARLMGLSKEASTKFTFLLSVPIIFGATISKINDISFSLNTIIGVLISFVVGIISIKFLLKYIKKHDFKIFAIYRLILANVVLIKYLFF